MAGLPGEGTTFGRYDVGRRIGRGGMGVVYEATHRDLQRTVALKLLSMDLLDNEALRNRFIREAQALAAVDSPMIVPVFDAGEHEGWLYIATKLFPDGDLGDWIQAHGALSRAESISVLAQVAEGLADAHEAGFLHRDVKPSNILLQRRPDGLRAVICDFGIAFAEGSEHTKTVGVIGTLGYMAPERHEGHPATAASDIYSLGCVLYACLRGQAPWVGTDVKVAMGHLYDPVPQLPEGSEALNRLLARALAKNPEERFATAREFRTALLGLDDVDDSTVVVDFAPEEPPTVVPPFATEVVAVPGSHVPGALPGPAPSAPDPTAAATVLGNAPVGGGPTAVGSNDAVPAPAATGGRRRRRAASIGAAAAALVIGALALTPILAGGGDEGENAAADPGVSSPSGSGYTPTSTPTITPTVAPPDRPSVGVEPSENAVVFGFAARPSTSDSVTFEYRRVGGDSTWKAAYGDNVVLRTSQGGEQACVLVRATVRTSSAMVTGPSARGCGRSKPKTLTLKLTGVCRPTAAGCDKVTLRATGLPRKKWAEVTTFLDGDPIGCTTPAGESNSCFSWKADAKGRLVNYVNWTGGGLVTVQLAGLSASVQVP